MSKPLAKKKRTVSKISDKQKAIDNLWRKFNNAMEELDELSGELDEFEEEYEMELPDSTKEAVAGAWSSLENVYSYGASILPAHSNDGGKA